jgi:DNA-binding NarL/FixJ family response regulator
MSGGARILLADDHAFVRELLRVQLEREPGLEVVAAAGDSDRALADARRLVPDLALLDIDMPGPPVFAAAARMRDEMPSLRIIFLSAYVSDHHVQQALDLGAVGYISKTEPLEVIVQAVRAVAAGGVFWSPEVRDRIVLDLAEPARPQPRCARLALLTPREQEVLAAVARGLAKKQVADLLSISVKTVDRHCTHVMNKLGIHDRVELARFAIREGVIEA